MEIESIYEVSALINWIVVKLKKIGRVAIINFLKKFLLKFK